MKKTHLSFCFLVLGMSAFTAPVSQAYWLQTPGTRTDFVCQFKEDQVQIIAKFSILNIEEDPALQGEAYDDDHITSNRVVNSPIVFQYKTLKSGSITPTNPLNAISAGAFDQSVDLNQVTEADHPYLVMSTADTDNCLTLELKLDQANGYKTGTYKLTSCGDGSKRLTPVACTVSAPVAVDIPAPPTEP